MFSNIKKKLYINSIKQDAEGLQVNPVKRNLLSFVNFKVFKKYPDWQSLLKLISVIMQNKTMNDNTFSKKELYLKKQTNSIENACNAKENNSKLIDFYKKNVLCEQSKSARDQIFKQYTSKPDKKEFLEKHIENISKTPVEKMPNSSIVLNIIKDMALFPELYIDMDKNELSTLCEIIDQYDDISVYTGSSIGSGIAEKLKLPKMHGFVAIGVDSLYDGATFSGASDIKRTKMKLPSEFKKCLTDLMEMEKYDETKINEVKQSKFFDSYKIECLLNELGADEKIKKSFKKILHSWIRNRCFYTNELWLLPRSNMQITDTKDFISTMNKKLRQHKQDNCLDHIRHIFTRKAAVRKQVRKPSAIIKNYIAMERQKHNFDENRSIAYNSDERPIFKLIPIGSGAGNCNTMTRIIAGTANVNTASLANKIGSTTSEKLLKSFENSYIKPASTTD